MTGGMAYEALNNLGHSGRDVHHRAQRQRPLLRARRCRSLGESLARIRLNPVYMRRQRRLEELLRELPLVGRPAEKGLEAVKAAVREYCRAAGVLRDARRALRRPGRRPRHRGARGGVPQRGRVRRARSSSTSSPRRAAATRRPRTTTRSTSTTRRCSTRRSGRRKAVPTGYTQAFAEAIIKEAEHDARAGRHHRGHARLDRAAPVPGALPGPLLRRRHRRAARRHRAPPAWPWAACARSSPSTRRSSPGPATRSSSTSPCTACRSSSASTGPASPATTAPSHHGVSTWCCSRRCRA